LLSILTQINGKKAAFFGKMTKKHLSIIRNNIKTSVN
jgi:uncharacterized Zn-binding protein involved in type VI secretion